jgi:hypothetical protein
MKLQLTNDGHAVVRNGRPVYVTDDGELAFDAADSVATITRLSTELSAERDGARKAAQERAQLQKSLVTEMVGSRLATSGIAARLALPLDIVQARFSDAFKIENGELTAYDGDGHKLYSRANPGKSAHFGEAIEMLIDRHPNRDQILKSSSGASRPVGPANTGRASISRAALDALPPAKRMETVKAGILITD